MKKVIINAKIITNGQIIHNHNILFNRHIISISKELPLELEVIDAKGAYLSSGFIDIHIHGSGGADVMDATSEALQTISNTLLQTGTTSFLATTMTMAKSDIELALACVQLNKDNLEGAKILGVHLEGPFINPIKQGAQNAEYIQKPNQELLEPYMDIIKMITLAPEVEGAKAVLLFLQKYHPHILLSIGHSDATYEQTQESFKRGISHATHLFNAMNPLHHREPGIVGAVLEGEASCDIIADLIHIHPSFFNLLYKLKKDRLILITDAMRAGCMRCGEYNLGGQRVRVKDGEARLADGTLAGSVLTMNKALKNFYHHCEIALPELIEMVTKVPAQRLGLKDKGELKVGFCADLVLFDKEFTVLKTFIDGEIKYVHSTNS
ncbi:MAG TPA: N-acetylglucosamine-6-phosphate deacetylase [Campylobacterales bacterium]|nr:N-acetylglucosamine-6-phosphate deacetylase [Campylobacterales bacterium]